MPAGRSAIAATAYSLFVSLVPPVVITWSLSSPVRRADSGLFPDPICDAFHNSTGNRPRSVMLKDVHHLVRHDSADLERDMFQFRVGPLGDAGEVRKGEVHLFVERVEVGAAGVGDAAKVVQFEKDAAGWGNGRGRRVACSCDISVEGIEDGIDGALKQLIGSRSVIEEGPGACRSGETACQSWMDSKAGCARLRRDPHQDERGRCSPGLGADEVESAWNSRHDQRREP